MRRVAALVLVVLFACHHDAQRKGREAALKHDLLEMRKALASFREDKKRGPHSLSELKTTHYLHNIPIDPITGARNWRVTTEEVVWSDDFVPGTAPAPESEVIDVHSRASGKDLDGKAYTEY